MGSSLCVYQLICSCEASYIDRTQKALSLHAGEHISAWLKKWVTRSSDSSMFFHVTDGEYHIKID